MARKGETQCKDRILFCRHKSGPVYLGGNGGNHAVSHVEPSQDQADAGARHNERNQEAQAISLKLLLGEMRKHKAGEQVPNSRGSPSAPMENLSSGFE